MVLGMRAFRFTVFLALSAGLLSAAGYLWAPLVSPKAAPLRLAAPLIRSQVITPFHVAPVDLRVAPVRLVPLRIVGTLHLQPARIVAPPAVDRAAGSDTDPAAHTDTAAERRVVEAGLGLRRLEPRAHRPRERASLAVQQVSPTTPVLHEAPQASVGRRGKPVVGGVEILSRRVRREVERQVSEHEQVLFCLRGSLNHSLIALDERLLIVK